MRLPQYLQQLLPRLQLSTRRAEARVIALVVLDEDVAPAASHNPVQALTSSMRS
jgi:hypothetical protein